MTQVGSIHVDNVTYSVQPLEETNDNDLTNTSTNGISFPSVPNIEGLYDINNQPIYQITFNFNPPGVHSLSSVIVNAESNVIQFSITFFTVSNPYEPYRNSHGDVLSYKSTTNSNSQASIVNFPSEVPSPLSAIRIAILSTTDDE